MLKVARLTSTYGEGASTALLPGHRSLAVGAGITLGARTSGSEVSA